MPPSTSPPAFLPTPPLPLSPHSVSRPTNISPRTPRMHFLDPVHSLPEFISHVFVSCSLGLAGIFGAKATSHARALHRGDMRTRQLEEAGRKKESERRRSELREGVGQAGRDWTDIQVDRWAGVKVKVEELPRLGALDEMKQWDRRLGQGNGE